MQIHPNPYVEHTALMDSQYQAVCDMVEPFMSLILSKMSNSNALLKDNDTTLYCVTSCLASTIRNLKLSIDFNRHQCDYVAVIANPISICEDLNSMCEEDSGLESILKFLEQELKECKLSIYERDKKEKENKSFCEMLWLTPSLIAHLRISAAVKLLEKIWESREELLCQENPKERECILDYTATLLESIIQYSKNDSCDFSGCVLDEDRLLVKYRTLKEVVSRNCCEGSFASQCVKFMPVEVFDSMNLFGDLSGILELGKELYRANKEHDNSLLSFVLMFDEITGIESFLEN